MNPPMEIMNQGKPDECLACAVSAIGESALGVLIDPSYTYRMAGDGQFGLLPEKVCESVIRDGLQPMAGGGPVKAFSCFRKVFTFPFLLDTFAGIRRVLLTNKDGVLAGCYWQPEWDKCPGGIIDGMYQDLSIFPHAFRVYGTVVKDGIMYLAVQNSTGRDKGDNGTFYFPREVADRFQFAYYFI